MSTPTPRQKRKARSAIRLFAFVLLLKALVPPGYMIDAARAAGAWPIVLCPDGLLPAGVELPHHPAPSREQPAADVAHHHSAAHGEPIGSPDTNGSPDAGSGKPSADADGKCLFVSLAAPAVPVVAVDAGLQPMLVGRVITPTSAVAIGRGLAAPPPPATGPPNLL